jgi:hypothetical protein
MIYITFKTGSPKFSSTTAKSARLAHSRAAASVEGKMTGAFAFTHTAYLLKLVIPTTNALPRWRLNAETKTKRTMHRSSRPSFN